MLILSRKKHEALVINGNIKVTVQQIKGDRVRLGVEAPEEVVILREEVLHKDKQNDKAA